MAYANKICDTCTSRSSEERCSSCMELLECGTPVFHNYIEDLMAVRTVKVDYFKESGKWYMVDYVQVPAMLGVYGIHDYLKVHNLLMNFPMAVVSGETSDDSIMFPHMLLQKDGKW